MTFLEFTKYAFTHKKQVITNLFDAELKGKELQLAYNGEDIIIYYSDESEDRTVFILYSAKIGLLEFHKFFPEMGKKPLTNFTKEINMQRASEIIKRTWRKRSLPPRFELVTLAFMMATIVIATLEIAILAAMTIRKLIQ